MKNLEEKIAEIVDLPVGDHAIQAILALLAQEVKRVIGEDDVAVYSSEEGIVHIKNKLRAAQRRKAGLV